MSRSLQGVLCPSAIQRGQDQRHPPVWAGARPDSKARLRASRAEGLPPAACAGEGIGPQASAAPPFALPDFK